ncbi:hypothetical protein, partial [Bathymodiolus platifrons methanotrophic gill symbiont]|uniref:hypothetical protein n=1 Tax=Bathymodiolus platifrons methanotrophic gill symbiont TaxID=113268 RepID=UPI001B7D7C8E
DIKPYNSGFRFFATEPLFLAYEVLYPKNPKPDRDKHVYWSSSEFENYKAWMVDGISGLRDKEEKDAPNYIVAIRSF